ncbi:hypothetical protein LDO31_12815 [Luteimonas sp. XNQY3]|nr:hypothetical protein [Luteimonas sp. XNQY3]MCD9007100.1 hypothetical protein [Luteimonas sp. XNQY3]
MQRLILPPGNEATVDPHLHRHATLSAPYTMPPRRCRPRRCWPTRCCVA